MRLLFKRNVFDNKKIMIMFDKKVKFLPFLVVVCAIPLYFYFNKKTEQVVAQPDKWIMINNSEANMLNYKNGKLFYEDVDLNSIAKRYGTPVYVYSKAKIVDNCEGYNKAFQEHGFKNYKVHFAMKANSNLSVLKLALKHGLGIDAVSVGEIKKARFAGFAYKDIVFSGVGKSEDDLKFSVKNGIGQINIESFEEIEMLIEVANRLKKTANVAIRINPDIKAHTHEKISTGGKKNKFGIDAKKLDEAIALIKTCKYLNFNGLSIHIGSQLTKLEDFEKAFSFVANIYKDHPEFETVDLGGGLGINYNNGEIISKSEYVGLIAKYFSDFNGKIMIEPGRSIIGDASVFLTKIVRIKRTDAANFIIVDGGMNNLVRPAMYGAWHQPMLTKNNIDTTGEVEKYDIVGPICESGDIFAKDVLLNKITDEDNYVAFLYAGAYGKSMASGYNLHDIARELMVDGKRVIEISKPIRWEDLVKFEMA